MSDDNKKKSSYSIPKRIAAFTLSALMAGMSFLGFGAFGNKDKNEDKDEHDHRHPEYSTVAPLLPSDDFSYPSIDPKPTLRPTPEILRPDDEYSEDPIENPNIKPGESINPDYQQNPSYTPSVEPGESLDPDIENHTHSFEEWVAIDDDYEQSLCSCGEVIKQLHHYETITTNNTINSLDGTHTIKTEKKCTSCGHEMEVLETHSLGKWTYNKKTGLDERICPKDDTIDTRKHECTNKKITRFDDSFEYHKCDDCGKVTKVRHNIKSKVLEDGSILYTCLNEGCDYKKLDEQEVEHVHSFKLNNYDSIYEYYQCDCGETNKVKHTIETKILPDGSTLYSCTNDGCSYSRVVKPSHSHSYKLVRYDDSYEYYECSCGESKKTAHNLSTRNLADGSIVYTCKNQGCGYTKTEAPKHQHKADKFLRYVGNVEYWSCSCGEEITLSHNLGSLETEPGTFDKVRKCTTPGCGYEERTKHTHQKAVFEDFDGEEEHWICPECKEVILTTGHTLGEEHMASSSYDYIQECTTPGCDYEKVIPHSQRHKYEIASKDETYEYWECVCGDNYMKPHSYNDGVPQDDGTFLETCETCGYTRKTHTCERGRSVRENLMNDEGCYRYAYYCKICDKFLGYGDIVPHDTYQDGDTIYCWNCGYTKPAEEEQIIDKEEVMILERKKEKGLSNEK